MTDDRHEQGMYLNDVLARSEARVAAELRAATSPPADPLAEAREALVLYATTTRTVTADGLAPLIDRLVAEATPAPDACQLHAFTGQPGTPCPHCTHSRYADCHPTQD